MKPVEESSKTRARPGRPLVYTPAQLLDRLVQAVIDLLAEQGASADVSVAQIAARAKVSKRTVYTAIESKEELIALVIRRDAESITSLFDQPVANAVDARAVLRQFLTQWATLACGPTAVGVFVMAICERNRSPAIGAAYQRSRYEFGFRKLAAWLARMDAQQFLRAADPDQLAEFVLTLVASERQRKLALGLDAPLTDAQLDDRITAILDLVWPT